MLAASLALDLLLRLLSYAACRHVRTFRTMSDSTALSLLVTVVPLGIALGVYGLLRSRGMRALTAGCICAAVGVVASFIATAVLLATTM